MFIDTCEYVMHDDFIENVLPVHVEKVAHATFKPIYSVEETTEFKEKLRYDRIIDDQQIILFIEETGIENVFYKVDLHADTCYVKCSEEQLKKHIITKIIPQFYTYEPVYANSMYDYDKIIDIKAIFPWRELICAYLRNDATDPIRRAVECGELKINAAAVATAIAAATAAARAGCDEAISIRAGIAAAEVIP